MNISEIKDLMAQFDTSSLREFSYKNGTDELSFSKNRQGSISSVQTVPVPAANSVSTVASVDAEAVPAISKNEESTAAAAPVAETAEGEIVESPLVGVAYLASAPDKPAFISVGDSVKKGQTLLIIEAMKVMNEVPAPKDGVVTEILVANEEVVEFGKGLVRIK
ncbi:acetyl-CoA carboxylase biotin carboxyl carrier protein [Streptococcus mutans]|uniref:acetyl-CoA carboxylase biotin carboxyl carrier protein n=1 Tax=Streptococcus mutans TaxID=1309 RepID=UPI00031FE5BC|nr:acetyl-CoA carboxylase biotin carboxyl carrier protein [Streptococcus mutans]